MGELADEGPLDPGLAGDGVALDDDDAASDRAVVKCCPYGGEVVREAIEIRDGTVGAVELKAGGELIADGFDVFTGDLHLTSAYQACNQLITCVFLGHENLS